LLELSVLDNRRNSESLLRHTMRGLGIYPPNKNFSCLFPERVDKNRPNSLAVGNRWATSGRWVGDLKKVAPLFSPRKIVQHEVASNLSQLCTVFGKTIILSAADEALPHHLCRLCRHSGR